MERLYEGFYYSVQEPFRDQLPVFVVKDIGSEQVCTQHVQQVKRDQDQLVPRART